MLTSPAGFEEQILPGLANQSLAASRVCARSLPVTATNAGLAFSVTAEGRLGEVFATRPGDLLSACIARQLTNTNLAGLKLPAKTGVKLQLLFGPAVADGGVSGAR
jgi:hypothetical protein